MKGALDDMEIDVPCENCGKKIKKSIGWVKRNKSLKCNCGASINIDTSQFKSELANVERSLNDVFK